MEIRGFFFLSSVIANTTDDVWVGQYFVYCGWLVFEFGFVLTMIVETKGL